MPALLLVAFLPFITALRPVILVADVGVDDAAAFLLTLSDPSLKVLGVASTFGCHKEVEQTARNAERLLSAANRSDVPVYRGARFPLGTTGLMSIDGSYVHGSDGFGDLPDVEYESCSPAENGGISAAEFIAQSARAAPSTIDILSFSPLTNVALALAIEPRLPELVNSLIAMGGAVYAPGNASPLAEANFLHDAQAAKLVVHAFSQHAGKLILAPLDVTNPSVVGASGVERMRTGGKAAAMFASAWPVYQTAYCHLAGMCDGTPLHDAHPVAYLLAPHLYTRVEEMALEVVDSPGGAAHGMSLFDRRGKRRGEAHGTTVSNTGTVTVLLDVDREAFAHFLTESVARGKPIK